MRRLFGIVCVSLDGLIGDGLRIPWDFDIDDMNFFKGKTLFNTVIMGHNTYRSIGHPLKNRRNIVVSSNKSLSISGCEVAESPEAALSLCGDEDVYVIGGSMIYEALLPMCDSVFVSTVHISMPESGLQDPIYFKHNLLEDRIPYAIDSFFNPSGSIRLTIDEWRWANEVPKSPLEYL